MDILVAHVGGAGCYLRVYPQQQSTLLRREDSGASADVTAACLDTFVSYLSYVPRVNLTPLLYPCKFQKPRSTTRTSEACAAIKNSRGRRLVLDTHTHMAQAPGKTEVDSDDNSSGSSGNTDSYDVIGSRNAGRSSNARSPVKDNVSHRGLKVAYIPEICIPKAAKFPSPNRIERLNS